MKIRFLLLGIIGLLALSCDETGIDPEGRLQLHAVAAPQGVARSSGIAFAVGDEAFIALGRTKDGELISTGWRFSPAGNSWTEWTGFPGKERVNATAIAVGDSVFIGLGYSTPTEYYNEAGQLRDWWSYHPAHDRWCRLDSFPSLATNACVSVVAGDYLYIGFGFNSTTFTNEWWSYHLKLGRWKQLAVPPAPRRAGAVACSDGERIFVGTGYRSFNHDDWWEYFPANDTWKRRAPMPDKGRDRALAFSLEGRFFVATGRYFRGLTDGGHVKDDLLEYDAAHDKWIRRGTIPGGGRQNALVFVVNNKAYIGYGENDTTLLDNLWSLEL